MLAHTHAACLSHLSLLPHQSTRPGKSTLTDSLVAAAGIMAGCSVALTTDGSCHTYTTCGGLLTGSYSSVAANEVFSPEGGDFVNVAINMNGDPAKAKQAMLSVLRQVGPASSGAGWRL